VTLELEIFIKKSCGENQNTHFIFINTFVENRADYVREQGKAIWW
jgi:hypothetical protein